MEQQKRNKKEEKCLTRKNRLVSLSKWQNTSEEDGNCPLLPPKAVTTSTTQKIEKNEGKGRILLTGEE